MTTIAVLAGTGFIGRHIADLWTAIAKPDRRLRLLVRRPPPDWAPMPHAEFYPVDLESSATLRGALSDCDGLINLLRPDGTGRTLSIVRNVLAALPSHAQAVIHASSIDVYGNAGARLVTEDSPAAPPTPYAQEHLAIEAKVARAPAPVTILRLGAVFGTGGKNLLRMAHQVASEPTAKLALRRALNGRRRFHLVSAEFVATAIIQLATRQVELPKLVLLTEDTDENNHFAFVQSRFAAAFGREIPPVGFAPPWMLGTAGMLLGRSVVDPRRRFSNARAADLGLKAPRPFSESVDRYAASLAGDLKRGAS